MTAEEFFTLHYPKCKKEKYELSFIAYEMIEFAESYHNLKTKQQKTELLSVGSYEQEKNNKS